MLSKECINCKDRHNCSKRFINAKKGDYIYCPDGSQILIEIEVDAQCL